MTHRSKNIVRVRRRKAGWYVVTADVRVDGEVRRMAFELMHCPGNGIWLPASWCLSYDEQGTTLYAALYQRKYEALESVPQSLVTERYGLRRPGKIPVKKPPWTGQKKAPGGV